MFSTGDLSLLGYCFFRNSFAVIILRIKMNVLKSLLLHNITEPIFGWKSQPKGLSPPCRVSSCLGAVLLYFPLASPSLTNIFVWWCNRCPFLPFLKTTICLVQCGLGIIVDTSPLFSTTILDRFAHFEHSCPNWTNTARAIWNARSNLNWSFLDSPAPV